MEKYIGIWLDHQRAIIITIAGEIESRYTIHSEAETRLRIEGEGKHTRQGNAYLTTEHRHEERLKHQLANYYEEIGTYVKEVSDLLIFGPGEAKMELVKSFRNHKALAEKIRQVETADRLTENQVAERVRTFTAKMRSFKHPFAHPYSV